MSLTKNSYLCIIVSSIIICHHCSTTRCCLYVFFIWISDTIFEKQSLRHICIVLKSYTCIFLKILGMRRIQHQMYVFQALFRHTGQPWHPWNSTWTVPGTNIDFQFLILLDDCWVFHFTVNHGRCWCFHHFRTWSSLSKQCSSQIQMIGH